MEVVLCAEDQSLVLLYTLNLVRPLASNLDSRLNGLGTSVHRENHIVAKHLPNLLRPLGEDIVVESTRAQCQTTGLLGQGLDELWVAVTLVDGTVSGKEVEVVGALWVPDVYALRAGEDDRKRVVVVGGILVLAGDGRGGGRGVEARVVGRVGGRDRVVSVRSHVGRWSIGSRYVEGG